MSNQFAMALSRVPRASTRLPTTACFSPDLAASIRRVKGALALAVLAGMFVFNVELLLVLVAWLRWLREISRS